MLQITTILVALVLCAPENPVEIKLAQVAPALKGSELRRSAGETRAVILLHGLHPHPVRDSSAARADFSGWEESDSALVKALRRDADVFSIAYSQQMPVETVAESPILRKHIDSIRRLGYSEIVLVGFSAGALISRYYVEDQPDCGVNKVIQVCAPNGGTSWGKFTPGVRQSQEPFLQSLSKESRKLASWSREGKRIPPNVEFVVVVGSLVRVGDGLVRADSQWTRELQDQGVPAVVLRTSHLTAMRSKSVSAKIAELVREPQPRWTPAEVEAARIRIVGKEN